MPVGDIHWAILPRSDGYEQSGRRPVMILQDDGYAGSLPTVLIVPLSSSLAAQRFPGTVLLPATAENGLATDSVLLVFQVRALDRRRLQSRIGAAEPAVVAQVYQALDQLTGHP
jgi:mRNA interferase MazF